MTQIDWRYRKKIKNWITESRLPKMCLVKTRFKLGILTRDVKENIEQKPNCQESIIALVDNCK